MLSLGVSALADTKTKMTKNKKTIISNLLTRIIVRSRTTLYSIARLEKTPPLDYWRNSTPFFGKTTL